MDRFRSRPPRRLQEVVEPYLKRRLMPDGEPRPLTSDEAERQGNELTEEQQWAKLGLIVEVANEVWG